MLKWGCTTINNSYYIMYYEIQGVSDMHQISVTECKYELTNVSVRDISNISLVAIYYDPSSSGTYLPSPMAEPISSE